MSTASAPGLGLSLTPGQEGGLSSSPFLAPSAAAAAGTVGRGLSLPAVPGLGSLLFDLRPNYGGGSEDDGELLQNALAHTAALSAPDPAAGHRRPTPLPETPGPSWACLGQSLLGSLLLSPGSWCTQGFVFPLQESVSPVLCKFWWFYGGVNGDLLQEGLCHTQVCCPQSPSSRPLLTRTSTGDTQT